MFPVSFGLCFFLALWSSFSLSVVIGCFSPWKHILQNCKKLPSWFSSSLPYITANLRPRFRCSWKSFKDFFFFLPPYLYICTWPLELSEKKTFHRKYFTLLQRKIQFSNMATQSAQMTSGSHVLMNETILNITFRLNFSIDLVAWWMTSWARKGKCVTQWILLELLEAFDTLLKACS